MRLLASCRNRSDPERPAKSRFRGPRPLTQRFDSSEPTSKIYDPRGHNCAVTIRVCVHSIDRAVKSPHTTTISPPSYGTTYEIVYGLKDRPAHFSPHSCARMTIQPSGTNTLGPSTSIPLSICTTLCRGIQTFIRGQRCSDVRRITGACLRSTIPLANSLGIARRSSTGASSKLQVLSYARERVF